MIIIKQLGRGKIQPYQWLSILYIILGYLYKDFSIWRGKWGKMKIKKCSCFSTRTQGGKLNMQLGKPVNSGGGGDNTKYKGSG